MKKKIRLFKPLVGREELRSVAKVFSDSWLGLGKKTEEFEKKISKKFKLKYSVATNSGTSALNLAIKCLNLPKGKSVMVNNMTFVSSATCILSNDLKPIFIDCDKKNLAFDLNDAKKKFTKNVVAILVVHYGGYAANMKDIISFANTKKIKVIEDCAHSQGGTYNQKTLGSLGDIGCFSFEEKKGMTTGDGGMLVTNNRKIYNLAKKIRWLGIDKSTWERNKIRSQKFKHWKYKIDLLGDKWHMNDLSAAIGIAQLKKLDFINRKKKELVKEYRKNIQTSNKVQFLIEDFNDEHVYWLFGLKTSRRDSCIDYLEKKGISTGVHHIPLTKFNLFKNYKNNQKNSTNLYNQILTLPLHASMSKKDVIFISKTVNEFFTIQSKNYRN